MTLRYHERTKHHPHRYARSLGRLDWATQPDPFRRYAGAPRLPLDHPSTVEGPAYDDMFESQSISARPLDRASLSRLFYDSLALSAWKQAPGTPPWSLRVNPSSGDLHPTEGYLIAGPIDALANEAGVYHYCPFDHTLEQRVRFTHDEWLTLARQLPPHALLLALSSIYWRESWKYGERAFRYCHHDVGHAIAALTLAAKTLGWEARMILQVNDQTLATLLGLHEQRGPEAEHPDCLLAVFPPAGLATRSWLPLTLPTPLLQRLSSTSFVGTVNRLSTAHCPWPIIDEVSAATRYDGRSVADQDTAPGFATGAAKPSCGEVVSDGARTLDARQIIRTRRSAVAMDGETYIDRQAFFQMLARITPELCPAPFGVFPWQPRVSLALFVHRVTGLTRGLYALIRHPSHEPSWRTALNPEFAWERPAACPGTLALYLLQAADTRRLASTVSCHQDIASDGVFSLGMLAHFEPALRQEGPWLYPRLFWETGIIGQLLYLEAEAAGVRATGIGCFFDDLMHEALGIRDRSWQSLYHFTVGGAVDDPRLQTLDAYAHVT